MSQLLSLVNQLVEDPSWLLAAEDDDGEGSIIPEFTPTVPEEVEGSAGTVLGWTAGIGLSMGVLGALIGWACIPIGHNTQRAELAARGKQAIIWSLVSGVGIASASGLVMAFYNMAA